MCEVLKEKNVNLVVICLQNLLKVLSVGEKMMKEDGSNPFVEQFLHCGGVERLQDF